MIMPINPSMVNPVVGALCYFPWTFLDAAVQTGLFEKDLAGGLSAGNLPVRSPFNASARRWAVAGEFPFALNYAEKFSWNREEFRQKSLAVSKSLRYSELRFFRSCALRAGFGVEQEN
jgi:hypothetical protein